VASYLNVAQADLAVSELAVEDIPARLENAAFLSWFWHYSNATGGVQLGVLDRDAERARAVLRPSRETAAAIEPPWQCPKCGVPVDAAWIICWHCGTSKEGEEAPRFWEEPQPSRQWSERAKQTAAIVIGLSGPLVFAGSHGSLPALLIWALVAACLGSFLSQPAEEELAVSPAEGPSRLMLEAEAADRLGGADEYDPVEETILRAWQAAVLSLWFFPLAFYSLWVLLTLTLPDCPLQPRERRRYLGAWVFNLLSCGWALPFWMIFLFRAH
jgi:hypothetical protein